MIFKEDWEQVKQGFAAFWEGRSVGKCAFAATAPRDVPLPVDLVCRSPRRHEDRWLDSELILNNALYEFAHTFYGGLAFPNLWVDLGPGVPAAFLGARHFFGEESIWYDGEHQLKDWQLAKTLEFQYDSFLWRKLLEFTEYYCNNSGGNFCVSITDLGGSPDIAAAFRGTQQIIYDMLDDPDEVTALIETIDRVWLEAYRTTRTMIGRSMEGTTDWLNLWCPEASYAVQCDLAAVMSPVLFEQFALPSLRRQTQFLDYSMFHLHMYDKPAQAAQLDMLLDLPELSGIAFIAESYDKDTSDDRWLPYYRKIQDKGKRLMIDRFRPEGLEKLVKSLSPDGLYLRADCRTQAQALQCMENVEKWSG